MGLEIEEWRDIPGYEGYYQVSDFGRVRSVSRTLCTGQKYKGKILKPKISKFGYLIVNLSVNGISKAKKIHRLVATAFLKNQDNHKYINHKDEDKSNNHLNNIEWCSVSYNNSYGTRIKRVIEKNTNNRLSMPIAQLSLDGSFIREFQSQNEIKRVLNFNQGNISNAVTGKCRTAYGYKWELINNK